MASSVLFTVIFIIVVVLVFLAVSNGSMGPKSIERMVGDVMKPKPVEKIVSGGVEPSNLYQSLDEYYTDFRQQQQSIDPTIKNKTIIRLHYTDWCKYCKEIKPSWIKLRRSVGQTSNNLVLMQTDHSKEPVPSITIVPTLVKHKPNGEIDIYNGKKTYSSINEWIHS